ncbi:SCO4402 family protein [Sandaracinus amylolyticus]|uniref:Uncharacterized protein n=1 Tax=Sandaracinus amylolyticus TaxID=927083 RepID=A0A0F6W4P8_9BACT|nr:hypothetical protein [Sandaracinus amylolyticus]AKF07258.1 hypothetical protein DB32_004407 [Sandaracinus amylolyticus]
MLKYPTMRAELVDYLELLGSPELRDGRGRSIQLDEPIHFLFDDTPLAQNAECTIGWYLVDADEARLVRDVISEIDRVFVAHGTEHPDAYFLALPAWDRVVSLARTAAATLKARDPGSWNTAP